MDWRWILHVTTGGLWLGCVLTEVAFERALQGPDRESRHRLAALHTRVDLFVEVPAMVVVLATGLALWRQSAVAAAGPPAWFRVKLGLVALAWVANAACVAVVLLRLAAARRGDMAHFDALDRLQHRLGVVVLAGVVGGLLAALVRG